MSKVLGSIITLAGAIAVNVIPGLGQVASAAILIGTAAVGYVVAALDHGTSKPETSESNIKQPIPPRVYAYGARRLFGASILYETSATGVTVDVYAFADGQANAITQIYLNDDKVTLIGDVVAGLPDKRYQGGRVVVAYRLGLPTETAYAQVIGQLPGIWTSAHRGDGVVTGMLLKIQEKNKDFLDTYPQGDNVTLSLAGQWQLVPDPRADPETVADESTWTYSDNPVRVFLHYLLKRRSVDFDTQILPQIDKWKAAADDCDEAQPLAAGGTEPRYRSCVVYKATEQPANVTAEMLTTFDGWYCVNERGEYVIYSGRYYEPTVSIGPSQIVGYRHQAYVETENAFNEIPVSYISDLHDYATVDAQAWRDEDAIAASGREPNTAPINAQVPSFTQGRRLAKRKMARANAPDRGTVTTTFAGRAVMGERFINLRIEEAGAVFFDGVAEITSLVRDPATGGVTFEWLSVDPNIDAWNPATEDGEGAPVGARVAPQPLEMPEILSAIYFGSDDSATGTAGARIRITIASEDRDDLTWFARWRVVASASWNEQQYSDVDAGTSVVLETGFVPVGADIEVEAAYQVGDGRVSPWSSPATLVATGSLTADSTLATSDTISITADRT